MSMDKIIPTRPLLILLYGYPGSGKTFLARQLSEHLQAAHLQGDRIRHELFSEPNNSKQEDETVDHLMDYMTEQFLSAGVSVIYDVNSMRLRQRRVMRDMARKTGTVPLLIWLQIDIESAFDRVAHRDRRRADDKYAIALDRTTFDGMVNNMQNPSREEDYIVISGKHNFDTQDRSVIKRLRELSLVTLGESAGKVVRPEMVNLVPNPAADRADDSRRNIIIR